MSRAEDEYSVDGRYEPERKARKLVRKGSVSEEGALYPSQPSAVEGAKPQIVAHGIEFVALPGMAPRLQELIPPAIRDAFMDADGFMGCIVLISEQEARLVNVITLWTGSRRAELCSGNARELEELLDPYVDRWLRARTFSSYVSLPAHGLEKSPEVDEECAI